MENFILPCMPVFGCMSVCLATYRKWARGGQTVTFKIIRGQWCNREPMAYSKLRESMDMFPKEIFEILTI